MKTTPRTVEGLRQALRAPEWNARLHHDREAIATIEAGFPNPIEVRKGWCGFCRAAGWGQRLVYFATATGTVEVTPLTCRRCGERMGRPVHREIPSTTKSANRGR